VKTLKAKIEEYFNNAKQEYQNEINDIKELLSDKNDKSGGIYFTLYMCNSKEELKIKLEVIEKKYKYLLTQNIQDLRGWDYFEDINYLEERQLKNFMNLMNKNFGKYNMNDYDYKIILPFINKLAYLYLEIDRLELTQSKTNKDRLIKKKPYKEILTLLSYLADDDEAVEPLIVLLLSMDGCFTNKLSIKQREIYFSNKKRYIKKRGFNFQKLKELKVNRTQEQNNLKLIIKQTKNKYVNAIYDEIINIFEI